MRQAARGCIVAFLLAVAFGVHTQKTVECHHFTGGHKHSVVDIVDNVGGGFLYLRIGHLRGYRPFADEGVEAFFLRAGVVDCLAIDICGTYRLVCLLCSLRIGMVMPHLHISFAMPAADFAGDCRDGILGEIQRVGTHVGDVSVLIEPLRHHHCLRHAETEFSGSFLLQCRCCEGRRRRAPLRLHSHIAHFEAGSSAAFQKCAGLLLAAKAPVQLRFHGRAAGNGIEHGRYSEIRLAAEVADFVLAIDYQPHRHTLHATGRKRGFQALPEHGRQLESHNAVEHTACLLGIDAGKVNAARMLYGIQNSFLGNFMEYNSFCILGLKAEHFIEVPCDSLSLAVLIGSEPYSPGSSRGTAQLAHHRLLVVGNLVDGRETFVEIYAYVAFLQVTDMAVAGHYLVVAAQKFLYSFCLCR